MGIPWKRIGHILEGVGKSGLVPIPGLPAAIEGVEAAFGQGQGATKLSIVSQIADVALNETLSLDALTADQVTQLQALKTAYISDYVAGRNLEAKIVADAQALQAFIASLKAAAPPKVG